MQIPTGIPEIDRRLDGGIQPGTLVMILLPPGADYLQLLGPGRGDRHAKLYTIIKSEAVMKQAVDRIRADNNNVDIQELDPGDTTWELSDEENPFDESVDLYFDTLGAIEKTLTTEIYIQMLNNLSENLVAVDSVGYFYCYKNSANSYHRTISLDIADLVIEVERMTTDGEMNYVLKLLKCNSKHLSGSDRLIKLGENKLL